MKKYFTLLLFIMGLSLLSKGQHYLQVGTNFPLQHSFRYDFRPVELFSVFVEPGVLTKP